MAVETAKDKLCFNQLVSQKKDTFIIDDDCIVPDVKPDILNILSNSGIVCIYKKEILDGKVRLDGCVNTYIMYLADTENETIRSLNTNLDFTQVLDVPGAKPGMCLDCNVCLRNIDSKVLNGRKINVKAVIEVDLKLSSNENIEYIKEINNMKDVQLLNKSFQVNSLLGTGSTKVYAKDTLMIDNIDNLVEIMKTDIRITNKDTKISYNKVLVKSDFVIKLLYLTEDNRINTVEGNIPVMGFIDMPNISEEHTCDVKYEVKNLVIKPNNVEEHSVYVEAEIECYCEAYENKEMNMIQDLYSPTRNLNFTQKRVKATQKKVSTQAVCNIREKQMIPEIGGNKIYDVEVSPMIQNQTMLNNRVVYEGEVGLEFVYASNANNGLETKQLEIPFNFSMDFEGVTPESNIDTVVEISLQDFVVMPDESIEMKIDLTFTGILSQDTSVNVIDNVEEGETRSTQTCSLIIYYAKPGDTLWKIAKRFGTTVDEIARINQIENVDLLQVGRQLFIPRYHG